MNEEWKDVDQFPGYRISNYGRVIGKSGKLLKLQKNWRGYYRIGFYLPGPGQWKRPRKVLIHRLVHLTFGPPNVDNKPEVAHLDGSRTNNRADNLVWATSKENNSHRIVHGTSGVGSKNSRAVLNEQTVALIRNLYASGQGHTYTLAEQFGISQTTAFRVVSRKLWKHVP